MPEIKLTDRYIRIGVRDTEDFVKGTLRTHDIGRKGFSKRIAGKLKSTGKWGTQVYLVDKRETPETKTRFLIQANKYIKINKLGKPLSMSKLNTLL